MGAQQLLPLIPNQFFPSHHFPVSLRLGNVLAMEAPVTLHMVSRIPTPRVIPSEHVRRYQAFFSDPLTAQTPGKLDMYYCHFSKVVVQMAICVFGLWGTMKIPRQLW